MTDTNNTPDRTTPEANHPTDGPTARQPWLLYAVPQHSADGHRLNALAWANDERIAAYLDALIVRKPPADFSKLGPWLKHLPGNRAQKHARRRRLLERFRNDLHRPGFPRPDAVAEQADGLARLRSRMTAREWHLLRRAAAEGLKTVAESEGLRLGTLKSLLSRCRARLRPEEARLPGRGGS